MNDIATTSATAAQLAALLGQFMAEVMSYESDETFRLLQREDLSMPRIVALNIVERRGAASISEISSCLGLSLANTSMIVDKLVCSGFVTRAEDASDRRHKLVQLTEKGRALVQDLRSTRVAHAVQRMLLLPPDLLGRVVDVLREVNAQLPQLNMGGRASRAPEIVGRA
jgi:DNA-binding MarR family transcriptional regulator